MGRARQVRAETVLKEEVSSCQLEAGLTPIAPYSFLVEIDGITRAGFRECSGLDSSQDPVDYRETIALSVTSNLAGPVRSSITFKRGVTADASLWAWRKQAFDGKIECKNGSVVLLNDKGEEISRWNFRDAWPSNWTGPRFSATGNEVAIETLEIVHGGLEKA